MKDNLSAEKNIGNLTCLDGDLSQLTFSPLGKEHRPLMIKAIWKSHMELRGFLNWGKRTRSWNIDDVNIFINSHLRDTFPRQHFVFMVGEEMVGFGSLLPSYTPMDAQVSLWITSGYQGLGIGTQVVKILISIAFDIYGFTRLFYNHDACNEKSKRLAKKSGFRFSHTFDSTKEADEESGFWFSWVLHRPEGLPDGIIQGRPIEDFT